MEWFAGFQSGGCGRIGNGDKTARNDLGIRENYRLKGRR